MYIDCGKVVQISIFWMRNFSSLYNNCFLSWHFNQSLVMIIEAQL